jgi:hypothetical protein
MAFDFVRQFADTSFEDFSQALRRHRVGQGYPDRDDGFRAFLNLVTRKWFSRRWIIQEAGLPHVSKVRVVYGSRGTPWRAFWNVATCLVTNMALLPPRAEAFIREQAMSLSIIELIRSLHSIWTSSGGHPARLLAILLYFTRGWFEETDRRDRIFSLLGFTEEQPGYQGFKADYNETASEVFIKFAKYLFSELRSVEFLAVSHSRDLDGLPDKLPSWVPTWAGKMQFLVDAPSLSSVQGPSTLSPTDISFPGDGLTLRINAMLVSRIAAVGLGCPGFRGISPASLYQILKTWEEQILNSTPVRKRYLRSEDIAEVWNRTLMHRSPSLGKLGLPGTQSTVDYPMPLPKPIADQHRIFELFMDPNLFSEEDEKRFTFEDEIFGYLHNLANQISGDTPFVTTDGDIGLTRSGCFVEIKQDDLVCLIQGCPTPMLLRPEQSHFILLGSCYVDRYLDPEVQKELLAEHPQTSIEIR